MEIYPKLIMDALATVRYPGTGKNIVEAGMVEDDLRISGLHVSFSLIFDKPTNPFLKSLVKASEAAIHAYVGKEVEVEIHTKTLQAPRPEVGQLLPGVKNTIAVSSGKGGVGKSTVAANLAVGLSKLGYKVGLLDADVFGPSMPKMFHVEDAHPYAESVDGRDLIVPVESYGIKMLSIGFFVDPDQATLWRGAMACNALKQLIGDETGRLGLLHPRHASGYERYPSHVGADLAYYRCRHCQHAAESGVGRCTQRHQHVPERESECPHSRAGGKYGMVHSCRIAAKQILPVRERRGEAPCRRDACAFAGGQIPIVQSICENGDNGTPEVLNDGSQTGQAFMAFARRVVEETVLPECGTGTDKNRGSQEVVGYIIMYEPFCHGQDGFFNTIRKMAQDRRGTFGNTRGGD